MSSLWWLAMPVLLLPVWWHRQKREQARAQPLATARFVPRAVPDQVRVWRWADLILLLVRCLLLACVVAWLADPVIAWRGDTVLVARGADARLAEHAVAEAGFKDARRIELEAPRIFEWLGAHEREWRPEARLLLVGDIPMPATMPQFTHQVQLRTFAAPAQASLRHVAIVSPRAGDWRKLFAALDAPRRYAIDDAPGATTELVIWDKAQAPPSGLRAPLWWVTDAGAFPELRNAREIDGMRYADSAHGRLWTSAAWPPKDADSARNLFETWQRLHYASVPFTTPAQVLAPGRPRYVREAEGALRDVLAMAIVVLFSLERILAYARRR
jgi:hypothetical protein